MLDRLHRDPSPRGLGTLRHGHHQHPVGVLGAHLRGVDLGGQGEGAPERSIPALGGVGDGVGLLVALAAPADDGQGAVVHGDVDVLGIDAGHLAADREVVVVLLEVRERHPREALGRAAVAAKQIGNGVNPFAPAVYNLRFRTGDREVITTGTFENILGALNTRYGMKRVRVQPKMGYENRRINCIAEDNQVLHFEMVKV